MALADGTRLGPYEILSPIGAGGMGEVYRAKDTKLGREVAIKVLPEVFSQNRERLARFQREARLLASLNHPNIAAIHELEESDGKPFLVLEFVKGETLQERLKKGALAIEEGLEVCRQVAAGLEAAHEKGVIHRDLKPANVMITSEGNVKVLDFGLARTFEGELSESEEAHSPTITQGHTREGVILGTASYMSPEQARGRSLDKRTDIWSFGCLLYEVLAGRKAYEGPTVSDSIAQILAGDPDWDALPAKLNPRIGELLRRCLQKESTKRRRDVGDVRLEIEEVLADPGGILRAPVSDVTSVGWRRGILVGLAASLVLAALTGIIVWYLKPEAPRRLARFPIPTSESAPLAMTPFYTDVAISPNGRHIVYVARVEGGMQLYLRAVDQLEAIPIRGTKGFVVSPFFSPDSNEIGFSSDGLKKVPIQGGVPVTLASQQSLGADWGADGRVIFGTYRGGLYQIPAPGREPQVLTTPDRDNGEQYHVLPQILPNGEAILFSLLNDQGLQIALLDLETLKHRILTPGSNPHYSPTGHIVYGREGALWAVPFDLGRLQVTGEPVPMIEEVITKQPNGSANFGLSNEGSLIYVPGSITGPKATLVWVDRNGKEDPLGTDPRPYGDLRISPDGNRVAVSASVRDNFDVWIHDLEHNIESRITHDPSQDIFPIWTPDGQRIVFASARDGGIPNLYVKSADGTGEVERLQKSMAMTIPESWSLDGDLVFNTTSGIGVLSMDGEHTSRLLLDDDFIERDPIVSPDGRWIAYMSDESGRGEIYVRPFPNVDEGKWKISNDWGSRPRWSPDGKELFYLSRRKMVVVSVQTESTFTHRTPVVLFEQEYLTAPRAYDIHPDGQRFLMIKGAPRTEETSAPTEIILVQNWFEQLKRLVPTDN